MKESGQLAQLSTQALKERIRDIDKQIEQIADDSEEFNSFNESIEDQDVIIEENDFHLFI